MRFVFNKQSLISSFSVIILLLVAFQNCSQGGFQANHGMSEASLLSVNSVAQEVSLDSIQKDAVDEGFFGISPTTGDDVFAQYQLYRETNATTSADGTYLSWIISMGIFQIPDTTVSLNNHKTEYELKILDRDSLPICPVQSGAFFGSGFTLKSACSTFNVERKVTFVLRYRLQGQSWKTTTWIEP